MPKVISKSLYSQFINYKIIINHYILLLELMIEETSSISSSYPSLSSFLFAFENVLKVLDIDLRGLGFSKFIASLIAVLFPVSIILAIL